jgi:hypothetical protein
MNMQKARAWVWFIFMVVTLTAFTATFAKVPTYGFQPVIWALLFFVGVIAGQERIK